MIEEQFVSFDTARMLKEAGFDVECDWFYINDGSANTGIVIRSTSPRDHNMGIDFLSRPTQALAAKWLREVHGMHIEIYHRVTGYGYFITKIETNELLAIPTRGDETQFDIYEEAFENALRKAIKLIKK